MRRKNGVTLLEAMLVCAMFGLFAAPLAFTVRNLKDLWLQSDAKDDAVRHLVRARTSLVRDLRNASIVHSSNTTVGPNLGTGFDGDALTFLSLEQGSSWTLGPTGEPSYPLQITYYLVIPNPPGAVSAGPPDAAGYEQQDPFKWLVRRVDSGGSALNPSWTTWLTRPTAMLTGPNLSVVSQQLLGFRVLAGPPSWRLELSAVALRDARHRGRLGSVPLQGSQWTLVDRFSVQSQNP